MDVKYWNEVAESYDSEIFDVLAHDKNRLIRDRIEDFAAETKTASDLGCGPGKFLPILSRVFRHVYAYDISETCLEQARGNFNPHYLPSLAHAVSAQLEEGAHNYHT